ncbi:MAG: S-layer homology domain-containing protein [Ruminococcaceae bacterium]|nr:S-layer homology domain-containing protein [Oscillospiraceae bacterium]
MIRERKRKMIKKITAIILVFMFCLPTAVFGATEHDYIGMLQALGAIDYNTEFPMDSTMTRAQFAKMAVMISGYRDYVATNISVSPFVDVTHKYWGAPYIHTAVTNGLINGYIDGTFKPEDPINYEEALTIALKILGYTNNDFGSSWPNGQLGTANKLGLTDNTTAVCGENIRRRDAINILYNTLSASPKGESNSFINKLGYSMSDDVTIIATSRQDSSVSANKVSTTAGTFNINSSFDYSIVGMKGTMVTQHNDFVLFFPDGENRTHVSYAVYAALADDVLVYKNGEIKNLGLMSDTTVYMNGQQTSIKNAISSLDIGYTISVSYNEDGSINYATIESRGLSGPYIFKSSDTNSYTNAKTVIRDGKKSSIDEIAENDVCYYSEALETIWAYSKKVTGVYESATPNKDTPASVTVSGVVYALEGAEAFRALSSAGNFEYGDTVTLLLGRDGDVAGAVKPSVTISDTQVAGYLIEAGQKQFTNSNGDEYTSLYAKVVQPDGKAYEYTTSSNYKSIVNSVVYVSFSNGKAILKKVSAPSNVWGKVSYQNMTFGNKRLADNVEILDVSSVTENEPSLYKTVFVQRLDSININSNSILFCSYNSAGEIQKLILKNVTGDMFTYGIITKADVSSNGNMASYSYMADATSGSLSSSSIYSVTTGTPAKFVLSEGKVTSIAPLTYIGKPVSDITETLIKAGGKTYLMSDKVAIYEKTIATTYTYLDTPLATVIENKNDYQMRAYVDRDTSAGGRVRVIVIEKKI